ncbi:hypothetical protein [Lentzea terrae]|uniref:hypothetical protein n=1 Tax=Lentzea terrae TaxID=2200761 RepID=UPI001300BEC1|nr:hypothetical protein [Lentzea terrae]
MAFPLLFVLAPGTGPDGVSVCMIKATENNAQGGIHTQLFRRERAYSTAIPGVC